MKTAMVGVMLGAMVGLAAGCSYAQEVNGSSLLLNMQPLRSRFARCSPASTTSTCWGE